MPMGWHVAHGAGARRLRPALRLYLYALGDLDHNAKSPSLSPGGRWAGSRPSLQLQLTNDAASSVRLCSPRFAPAPCHVSESMRTASPVRSANHAVRRSPRSPPTLGGGIQRRPGKQRGSWVSGTNRVGPIVSSRMSCSARKTVTVRGVPHAASLCRSCAAVPGSLVMACSPSSSASRPSACTRIAPASVPRSAIRSTSSTQGEKGSKKSL
mmetsp:Transcript_30231/g.101030  ORF Transcript_30231/g.101030 Transcript_30231/m.101030 type:complete len:211 (-) Transcript_30231:259-891(-)